MPTLSVIVPIYNGAAFLKKCVDSILAQDYTDLEVVLVDDGSTDGSLEICREYEQADSRVTVFHKENEGLVAARKSGLSVAKGKYIGFVDCDDYIDSNMYSDLMAAVEKDNADIVVGGIAIDYPERSNKLYNMIPEGYYGKTEMQKDVIPKMLIHSGFVKFGIIPGVVVKVFKREILAKALPSVPDNLTNGEDVSITAYSFMCANSVSVIETAAYHYVQGDDSMIRKFNPDRFNYICNLYECLIKIENDDYKKQLNLYMSYLVFGVCAECVLKSGYKKKKIYRSLKTLLGHELSRTALRNSDTSSLSSKDKLKIFLMRHKMVAVLTFILERIAK